MAVITATRKRRQSPARRAAASAGNMQAREIAGLALIGLGTFLGMTLFLGVSVGPVGNGLETLVRLGVGRAVALAPLAFVALGVGVILRWEILTRPPFRAGALTLLCATQLALAGGILGLGGRTRTSWFDPTVMQGRGGLLGELEYVVTANTVGNPGTTLLVILGLIAGAVLVTGASLGLVLRRSGTGAAVAGRAMGRGARAVTLSAVRGGQILGEQVRTRLDVRDEPTSDMPRKLGTPEQPLDGADQYPDLFTTIGSLPRSPALGPELDGETAKSGTTLEPQGRVASERTAATVDEDEYEIPSPLETLIPPPNPTVGYRTPSKNVLKRSTGPTTQPASLIQETSRRLVETLGHFGVQAEVTEAVSGPRVTRYELQLAPGTKVSRVTALRDDLAYALAAREEIRIIAPIPGKQAVGVEVANPNATMVTLGDLFRDFPERAGPLMS
jgi:S-DNA-T family DNA segregation ATPase FtsK/SpoIIIE